MRVHSSVTSVSGFSEAVTGLMKLGFASGVSHYDSPPPDVLDSLEVMRDSDAFRFANRLEVWAEFDGEELLAHGHQGALSWGRPLSASVTRCNLRRSAHARLGP